MNLSFPDQVTLEKISKTISCMQSHMKQFSLLWPHLTPRGQDFKTLAFAFGQKAFM